MPVEGLVCACYRPSVYQRKDAYYARAKAEGYRSRAAFKLVQIARRTHLFHRGDHVLDLGAWPGGWLQVVTQLVGPAGKVVGVDLQAIAPLSEKNVTTLVGDIADEASRQRIIQACQGPVDVILSDLAPKLSGVRARDEAHAEALADYVLALAEEILKPGGKLIIKLFMGGAVERYLRQLRQRFGSVRTMRPEATRKGSAEIYAIASDFRGDATPVS